MTLKDKLYTALVNDYNQAVEMALKYKDGYLKLRGVLKEIREIIEGDRYTGSILIEFIDEKLKEYK